MALVEKLSIKAVLGDALVKEGVSSLLTSARSGLALVVTQGLCAILWSTFALPPFLDLRSDMITR